MWVYNVFVILSLMCMKEKRKNIYTQNTKSLTGTQGMATDKSLQLKLKLRDPLQITKA